MYYHYLNVLGSTIKSADILAHNNLNVALSLLQIFGLHKITRYYTPSSTGFRESLYIHRDFEHNALIPRFNTLRWLIFHGDNAQFRDGASSSSYCILRKNYKSTILIKLATMFFLATNQYLRT